MGGGGGGQQPGSQQPGRQGPFGPPISFFPPFLFFFLFFLSLLSSFPFLSFPFFSLFFFFFFCGGGGQGPLGPPPWIRAWLKGLRTVLIITGLFYVSVIPVFVTFSAMASEASLSQQTYDILIFISNVVLMCSCWWDVPVYMSTSSLVSQRALELRKKWKCCKIARHSNRIAYGDDLTLYDYSQTGLSWSFTKL